MNNIATSQHQLCNYCLDTHNILWDTHVLVAPSVPRVYALTFIRFLYEN